MSRRSQITIIDAIANANVGTNNFAPKAVPPMTDVLSESQQAEEQKSATGKKPEALPANPLPPLSPPAPKLEYHEFSGIFPLCSDEELNGIIGDIEENGLQEKIVLLDGKILDGRIRFKALQALGMDDLEQHYEEYAGGDPLSFVVSKNLHRRHLDESQRAMVAGKLANLQHGGNRKNQAANLPLDRTPPITQEKAAEMFKVGVRSVRDAKVVLNSGNDEIIETVVAGKKAVSTAANRIRAEKNQCMGTVPEFDPPIISFPGNNGEQSDEMPTALEGCSAVCGKRRPKDSLVSMPPLIAMLRESTIARNGNFADSPFDESVEGLMKLVSINWISAIVAQHAESCVRLQILRGVVDVCGKVDYVFPCRDIEKNLQAIENDMNDCIQWRKEAEEFNRAIYPQWLEVLTTQASTDEQKAALGTVKQQYADVQKQDLLFRKQIPMDDCTVIDTKPRNAQMRDLIPDFPELVDDAVDWFFDPNQLPSEESRMVEADEMTLSVE